MILDRKPLTMAEAKALVKDAEEKKPINLYLKSFTKLSKKDSDSLISELRALNNPKIKEANLVKIADFLPKDIEDLNKILSDAGLSEEESNAILKIVEKY